LFISPVLIPRMTMDELWLPALPPVPVSMVRERARIFRASSLLGGLLEFPGIRTGTMPVFVWGCLPGDVVVCA
jgi:hypothetical protein